MSHMLPAVASVWEEFPLVPFADRWLLGSPFGWGQALLQTPVSQMLILMVLGYLCFIKCLFLDGFKLLQLLWQPENALDGAKAQGNKVLQEVDLSMDYAHKGKDAANTFRFTPCIDAVRPDDAAFEGLDAVGYTFAPHYFTCFGLRVHYLDESPTTAGPAQGTLVLLHGNPTWSFMFRKMIPHLTAAGYRVVALDFLGFGKSDKLIKEEDITPELHATTVIALLEHLQLQDVTLVVHDCGAIYMQWCLPWLPTERISRMVLLNTAFPPHPLFRELDLSNAWLVTIWQAAVTLLLRNVQVSLVMKTMVPSLPLPDALGYGAPLPDNSHKAAMVRAPRLGALALMTASNLTHLRGLRFVQLLEAALPGLSDVLENNHHSMLRGESARASIRKVWMKPTLMLFGAPDPLFGSVQQRFTGLVYNATALSYRIDPVIIHGAGHYLPETKPLRAAAEIIKFVRST